MVSLLQGMLVRVGRVRRRNLRSTSRIVVGDLFRFSWVVGFGDVFGRAVRRARVRRRAMLAVAVGQFEVLRDDRFVLFWACRQGEGLISRLQFEPSL